MLWQWGCYGFDSYLGPFWVMGRYKKDPYLPMEEIFAIQRGVNKKTLDLLQFLVNILPPKNCSPQKITFSTIYYFSVTYSHHTLTFSISLSFPCSSTTQVSGFSFLYKGSVNIQLDLLTSQFPITTNNFTPLNTIN